MPRQHKKFVNSQSKSSRHVETTIESPRLALLEEILEESSSIHLNEVGTQHNARQALESHTKLLNLIGKLRGLESGLNPKLPERDEKSFSRFFAWLNSELTNGPNPRANFDEGLAIIDLGNTQAKDEVVSTDPTQSPYQECSLVAKKAFKKGDCIFDIHRRLMLTGETALKDPVLGNFIRNDSIASTMQNVGLVLHFLNEFSKGQSSFWKPYLDIMPCRILPVLSMSKDELKLLQSSAHIFEALKMVRAIVRQYTYFYKRLETTKLALVKDFTFLYYCWGVSIVCSRQNEIPPSDRQMYPLPVVNALIPLLDMCNHHHGSNQAIFEDNHSILFAPQDVQSGNEIKINYGNRTSGEFFIHNGFVPEVVRADLVPFTIALPKQGPLYEPKTKLLKILNMPNFGRFRLVGNTSENRHKRDPHLTMFLIVYFLSEKDLKVILESDNPVGMADFIYEYVQYSQYGTNRLEPNSRLEADKQTELISMSARILNEIQEYVSKRASIAVALIDRTIDDEKPPGHLLRLLEHEKRIYESYFNKIES